MAELDCTTERGRLFADAEAEVLAIFCHRYSTMEKGPLQVVRTPQDSSAHLDALFHRFGRLVLVGEIKVRRMCLQQLRDFKSYLISADKLMHGSQASKILRVPFVIIAGLTDATVWWQMNDADGKPSVQYTLEETITQATVNGGLRERVNAYVPLDHMYVIAEGVRVTEPVDA